MAPEPTSPNRAVIMILGAMFALAMGGGVGILLEATDPSVHTARQLQASLRIPVLAAIPQIWLESDRAAQRRGARARRARDGRRRRVRPRRRRRRTTPG